MVLEGWWVGEFVAVLNGDKQSHPPTWHRSIVTKYLGSTINLIELSIRAAGTKTANAGTDPANKISETKPVTLRLPRADQHRRTTMPDRVHRETGLFGPPAENPCTACHAWS